MCKVIKVVIIIFTVKTKQKNKFYLIMFCTRLNQNRLCPPKKGSLQLYVPNIAIITKYR